MLTISSLLSSCGSNSFAGTYGFQMGKDTGTHFGIFVTLTDNIFSSEDISSELQYKSLELTLSVHLNAESDTITELLETIKELLHQEDQDDVSLPGYYYNAGLTPKGETEIKFGIDLTIIKDIPILPDLLTIVLNPDTIEKMIYTTYASEVLTMNIPVSLADLLYQFYWYGIDFIMDEKGNISKNESPCGIHNPGTHPTIEDVTIINEQYNFYEIHESILELVDGEGSDYRDYYTLAMGLMKK